MALTINHFFLIVFLILLSVYFLFKPMVLKVEETQEVPLLELSHFTLQEFNTKGLMTTMSGSYGYQFSDRYEVKDINFTDNTTHFHDNIQADFGVYKNKILDVEGNVVFKRDDNLSFISDEARYDLKHSLVTTQKDFTIYQNSSWLEGQKLKFDNKNLSYRAENISSTYIFKKDDK